MVDVIMITVINIASRLLPHIPNMTTVGSAAIFMSAKYSWKKSLLVLFLTMIISDMILGFHSVMWATYGSFCISVFLGNKLRKKYTMKSIGYIALLSSLQFFIVTNFAVWLSGILYPKTLEGFIECFIMALPFFRNSLIGDVGYTYIFFGIFEVIKMYPEFRSRYFTVKKYSY